jgi:hypothetical protein
MFMIAAGLLHARQWSVFVYMAADNDLANFADLDLAEMQEIGSRDDVTIIVQVDKPSIGARRLLILQNDVLELENLGIIDMCDWQTLAQFLEWGIRYYPADRYCVVLWDHGSGWTRTSEKSFGEDWSSGSVLSVAAGELRQAVRTAYNRTGEKIDLFCFDACLMGMVEVVYDIKDYIRTYVGPQIICPLEGFPYDRILAEVVADPGMNRNECAAVIVETTVDNYVDVQPVVYGAVDATHFGELKQSLDECAESFTRTEDRLTLADTRESVQTIPTFGTIPSLTNEHVDCGDFINQLYTHYANAHTQSLVTAYNRLIVASAYWGDDFDRTTGLTIYFPYDYPDFRQLLDNYLGLTWAQETQWLKLLNWYYDADDIRPTDVTLSSSDVGGDNDFRLTWSSAFDLAPVTYSVVETGQPILFFSDPCEDSSQWYFSGFSLSSANVYAGNYSFFSGNASNLDNYVETRDPIHIDDLGLLSIFLDYNTEDMADSLIIEYGLFADVHYGFSDGWQERRVVLPPGVHNLKISYRTNSTTNRGGCYIDGITVHNLPQGRFIQQRFTDTTLYIYNKLLGQVLGQWQYAVHAADDYSNTSNVSAFVAVSIDNYAVPYSLPNPFQTSCYIIVDVPYDINPVIEVYALSGRLVRKFDVHEIENSRAEWDGKDEQGREVGSGVYYVVVRDVNGSFQRTGKIARQR